MLATRHDLIRVIPAEEAMRRINVLMGSIGIAMLIITACGADNAAQEEADEVTLTLVTHDSFAISDGVFESFRAETGITVEVLTSGDVGSLVAQTILSAENPVGDVVYGVDNTFMQRLLDSSAIDPYEAPALADVPDQFELIRHID